MSVGPRVSLRYTRGYNPRPHPGPLQESVKISASGDFKTNASCPPSVRLRIMSSHIATTQTITARFVLPVDQPPISGGSVTIDRTRIVAVEPRGARRADLDLGDAAILPGFVNAHTHLDLTGLRGCTLPGPNFVDWLRAVIANRREQQPDQVQRDIQLGLDECLASGTTLIGDIAAGGQSYSALAKAACRSVVFYELLGLSKPRAHQSWAAALAWIHSLPALANCRPGLSPHAPYSVRAGLFRAASKYAVLRNLPLAIHLAESLAELELLAQRSGPMVRFLQDLGVYDPSGLFNSFDELTETLRDSRHALLIHGNYLEPSAKSLQGTHIIYCPRTHHAFGHSAYPLAEFLRSGVRIALGTDSLASNPDLSLFNEARFVRQNHSSVTSKEILRMATLSGAEALGWERETGSLTPGKSADLAIVSLADVTGSDPELLVFGESAKVTGVMIDGRWHRDPRR